MKIQSCEIVERSSGFWVVDGLDAEGPFKSVKAAQKWIDNHSN
jgi:hypothetical protein